VVELVPEELLDELVVELVFVVLGAPLRSDPAIEARPPTPAAIAVTGMVEKLRFE
jgi:hypothetical protein